MTKRLVVFVLLAAAILFMSGVVLRPLFPLGLPPGVAGRQLFLLLQATSFAVAQVIAVVLLERGEWSLAGVGKAGWSPLAIVSALGLGVAVQGIASVAASFMGDGALAWTTPAGPLLMIAALSTLADAVMLRGYLFGAIAASFGALPALGVTTAAAIAMAAFGGDLSLAGAAEIGALAAFLGAVRLRTDSIFAAWIAHFAIETLAEGLGGAAPPGITAGLLAVVSFLLFIRRPRPSGSGRT